MTEEIGVIIEDYPCNKTLVMIEKKDKKKY